MLICFCLLPHIKFLIHMEQFCISLLIHGQASEDAKKLVDEERAFARAEIENARAAVQRVEEALQEQEQMSRASGKQVDLTYLYLLSDV